MKRKGVVDVYDCVRKMRFWRNYMVQTIVSNHFYFTCNTRCISLHGYLKEFCFQSQYSFIHLALLEHITSRVPPITAPVDNVEEIIKELSIINPRTNKTGFQQQFEVCWSAHYDVSCNNMYTVISHQNLERDSSKEQDFKYVKALLLKNRSKNRCQKFLPRKNTNLLIYWLPYIHC